MKRVLAAAFALLFLLSACQTRPTDAPAETVDPNEDLRTRDARLAALFAETDGPVVVQFINYKAVCLPSQIAKIWNAPHVMNVICTSLVHWLDISKEGSLSMIGQYLPDLDPAAIAEGRWYETENECCLNRAEYERLLADPDAHFTGIGDSVTYTENSTYSNPWIGGFTYESLQKDERGREIIASSAIAPISKTFTVVGIVGDEGKYADPAYGIHHMYALTDAVEAMLANYKDGVMGAESELDLEVYKPSTTMASLFVGSVVYKTDPENPDQVLLRSTADKIYTEEEWMENFYELPCNAGYTIEVTLDSGKNYQDFVDYYRSKLFMEMSVEEMEGQRQKSNANKVIRLEEELQKIGIPGRTDKYAKEMEAKLRAAFAPAEMESTIAQIYMLNEQKEWYICTGTAPYVIHPLRVGE